MKFKKLLLIGLVFISMLNIRSLVYAQSVGGLAYSNDPNTGFVQQNGANVVIFVSGGDGQSFNFTFNPPGYTAVGYVNGGKAFMGGFNGTFAGAGAGTTFTVSSAIGSASCTIVDDGGYKYCNVSVPGSGDADGDGVQDRYDSCPSTPGPVSNGGCPPPDGDGDGVPDSSDQCPMRPGPASNNGCPVTPAPQDRDGDGFLDSVDACPTQFGYHDGSPGPGCPLPPPPQPPQPPTNGSTSNTNQSPPPTPVPSSYRASVPDVNAPCNLTAKNAGKERINVRQDPSLESQVVSGFYPNYSPIQIIDSKVVDGVVWYKINFPSADDPSWVSSTVTIIGGQNCEQFNGTHAKPTDPTATIMPPAPIIKDAPKPAASTIDREMVDNLTLDHIDALFANCAELAPYYLQTIGIVEQINHERAFSVTREINAAADKCDAVRRWLEDPTSATLPEQPSSTEPIDPTLIVVQCLASATAQRQQEVVKAIEQNSYAIPSGAVITDDMQCQFIQQISAVGQLSKRELQLYDVLRNNCGLLSADAMSWLIYAIVHQADLSDILGQSINANSALCRDPKTALAPASNATISVPYPSLQTCPAIAQLLAHRRPNADQLAVVLADPEPCTAAQRYVALDILPQQDVVEAVAPPVNGNPALPIRAKVIVPATGVSPSEPNAPLAADKKDDKQDNPSDVEQIPLEYQLFSVAVLQDGMGLLSVRAVQSAEFDLVLIEAGGFRFITDSTDSDEKSPSLNSNGRLAFLRVAKDNRTTIVTYMSSLALQTQRPGLEIEPPDGYHFDPNYRLAWQPNSSVLWMTLIDAQGNSSIGQIDIRLCHPDENGQTATCDTGITPILTDSVNPAVVTFGDQPYLIYEHILKADTEGDLNGNRHQIEFQPLTKLENGKGTALPSQPKDSSCTFASALWTGNYVLYACQDGNIYLSDHRSEFSEMRVKTTLSDIRFIAIVPATTGFITFDDQQTIYYMRLSVGTTANPYFKGSTTIGAASGLVWISN